jgi:hypothetical protein
MDEQDTGASPSADESAAIGNLASLLGVSTEAPPDPPPSDIAVKQDSQDDPPPAAEKAPEDEEVDLGEVKLKLPKEQAEAVRKAALRQSDYTQKTMALAEQRKAAEAETAKIVAERQQYQQGFAVLRQQIEHAVNTGQLKAPDPEMLESDPVGYLRQKDQWDRAQQAYFEARSQQEKLQTQQESERQQQMSRRLQAEQEQLLAKLPDWRDAGKAQAEQQQLKEYLSTVGFSPEEIAQVQDHRGVLMAREAMLYRKMVAEQKSLAEKKVAAAPPRAIKPGVQQEQGGSRINQSAISRLRASGGRDTQSAAQAMKSLLFGE